MIYGFLTINGSVSNVPNVTNSVGELSEVGQTYAKSVRTYVESLTRLGVFFNEYDDVYVTTNIEAICEQAAELLNGFGSYAGAGALLTNAIDALGTGVNVSVGAGILNNVDAKTYPEWVQFTLPIVGEVVTFKVWLANTSWLAQYPKGDFDFVLPTNDLQSLWDDFEANKAQVDALTPLSLINKAQNEIVPPVTKYDSFMIRVYKRTDHSKFFDMPICVAVNGGVIFNNTVNYIAAFNALLVDTGPHTLEEWREVIPSLVPLNKFYVIPTWENKAIALSDPDLAPLVGSPSIVAAKPTSIKTEYFPGLVDDDVFGHLIYTTMAYKSYGLYILADIDNSTGRQTWKETFPDYFVRSINDLSAGLMSPDTLEMSILLDALIRLAETWLDGDDLPVDVTTLDSNNYTYVEKSVGNVTLLVLTYGSWLAQQ